ncbi:MAG TPA: nitroreductase [Planctomycetota bacterium]|nr:nitroreductase [Planctomycetota bacterium]
MDALKAIEERRAVRSYDSRAVDRATVERLIQAAIQAPSAVNAQPWAFAVIQDRKLLARVAAEAKALLLSGGLREELSGKYREILESPGFDIFYGAGTLIIICADTEKPNASEDCSLAGENLMLAATSLGLGTCPIGFARPYLNLPEVKEELGIAPHLAPVLPIIVGWPTGETPRPPREEPRIVFWRA